MSGIDSAALEYSAALSFLRAILGPEWQRTDWTDPPLQWCFFAPLRSRSPAQGWKIHVSASAGEAPRLLREVAALLASQRVPFKVPARIEDVVYINSGDGGAEQLGKVLTAYPADPQSARAALVGLDAAWPGSNGPEVATDLLVRAGAAVSYRYGVYRATDDEVVTSSGTHHFGLRLADGSLQADVRSASHGPEVEAPVWPGVSPAAPRVAASRPVEIAGCTYLPLVALGTTPRATTWMAVRVDTLDTVVIKSGRRGAGGDAAGLDVRDSMRGEHAALCRLQAIDGLAPQPIAFVDESAPLLVMGDLRGTLLCDLPREARIAALPSLADSVAKVHAAGLVHGDIKLENAVQQACGVSLIDFELAVPIGSTMRPGGTPGHLGPEVRGRPIPADAARDVFALGGCVVQALLDMPPGLVPLGRTGALLRNEGFNDAARCLRAWQATEPAARPDAAALAADLRRHADRWAALGPGAARHPQVSARRRRASDRWCRRAATDAASASSAFLRPRAVGACWSNEHFMRAHDCEGVNLGAAGIVMGLATIDAAFDRRDFDAAIQAGARWLASRKPAGKSAGPFTGNAGVAIALAVAGRRLADAELRTASRQRLQAAVIDGREVDLFSGQAGVLWSATLLNGLDPDDAPLTAGASIVANLRRCRASADGVPVWRLSASDAAFFGTAHGSAGVALALASWGRASGESTAIDEARETWSAMARGARTADGRALRIGPGESRHHAATNWCHGVAGFLWSMLAGVGDDPSLREEIDWAVDILANAPSVGTATYCHGLAGQLELWRMLHAVPRFAALARTRAHRVVRALRCMHLKRDGRCVWASDDPTIVTPDLWIGFLGPACALAMHATGATHALWSPAWLGRVARPATPSLARRATDSAPAVGVADRVAG